MKRIFLSALAAAAIGIFSAPAFAADAAPAIISFTVSANMPSIRDTKKTDSFQESITSSQIVDAFDLTCQAGHSKLFVMHVDRGCAVKGSGSIINPANPAQKFPRTQYLGNYLVDKDGMTDGSTLGVNYLALGKVPAATLAFAGSMNLKPELTSSGAAALRDVVLKKLNADANGAIVNQAVDTVDFSNLFIPSAGFPSDQGCKWNGHMVFSYQTSSWFMDLAANCNGKDYALKGNMPFTDSKPNDDSQTQYDLTLTVPSAAVTGDDALFASTTGSNGDLFAAADGITGQVIMKNSAYYDATIDNTTVHTATQVEAAGTLTGNNVPIEVVQSLAILFGLLPETLYGA